MKTTFDPVLVALDEVVRTDSAAATVAETLRRVMQKLEVSTGIMAWEVIPLNAFRALPESIRSCWIFVIRAGASTGAERHPNSHQRSFSLVGNGTFELHDATNWRAHPLVSRDNPDTEERWVSIPPSTWHRLQVGSAAWGMVSFHTVAPQELIEETPVDADDLDGETHREPYAGRT